MYVRTTYTPLSRERMKSKIAKYKKLKISEAAGYTEALVNMGKSNGNLIKRKIKILNLAGHEEERVVV